MNFGQFWGRAHGGKQNRSARRDMARRRASLEPLEGRLVLVGTPQLVLDILPGVNSSGVDSLTDVNGTLFFVADDGLSGRELWKTDGTAAGTVMVKDIRPGASSSLPQSLVNLNGTLFFVASDGISGLELWKSDGTANGTTLVKDIRVGGGSSQPDQLTAVNNLLFFVTDDGLTGRELWKSDGTANGTSLVRDIYSSSSSSSVPPRHLTRFNNVLVFAAYHPSFGFEPWRSDGTFSGTTLIADVLPGGNDSNPSNFAVVGSTLFFTAQDNANGAELWKTDGTSGGTILVQDIFPGTAGSGASYLTNINGTLYFRANDGSTGYELWKSDGTPQGTTLVRNIYLGNNSSNPGPFVDIDSTVFFPAEDAQAQRELWKSDGTALGTVLVKDISLFGASNPRSIVEFDSNAFFAADSTTGGELWTSDGTSAGTLLVLDIRNGSSSSDPSSLTKSGNRLFFTADNFTNGRELWMLPGSSPIVAADDIGIPQFTTFEDAQLVINSGSGPTGALGVGVLANDTGTGGPLTVTLTNADNLRGTLILRNDGGFTYTPEANFNGAATFRYRVNNGSGNSNEATAQIVVTAVNDPPSFNKGTDVTVAENSGAVSLPSWATAISPGAANESGQTLSFLVTQNTNPALFAAAPAISAATGTLTFTPATNVSGVADVTIALQDNGGGNSLSGPQTFRITVTDTSQMDIELVGQGQPIADGDTMPSAADGTDFGSVTAPGGARTRTFTIRNAGTEVLSLTGSPRVEILGSAFSVTAQPALGTLNPGQVTTFDVTFAPAAGGVHSGTVQIRSNDPDEASYEFSLAGSGASSFPTTFELSSLLPANGGNGSSGFVLDGANAFDRFAWSVASAGDINDDGYDDVIVGAVLVNQGSRSDAGAAYVVLGRAGGFPAALQVSTLNGANGFTLRGVDMDEQAGVSVSSAGDVNGDGVDDVIIGTHDINFAQDKIGQAYVVFGRRTAFPAAIELSALSGADGFRIGGVSPFEYAGQAVAGAGDINGDGFDDIMVGGLGASPNGGRSGTAYVIFGGSTPFPANFDPQTLNGTNGFTLNGAAAGDETGYSLANTGDFNGDGLDDMVVGAWKADPLGRQLAGKAYVIYGRSAAFPAQLNLGSLAASEGFAVHGESPDDSIGITADFIGDINGDGLDDLALGTPFQNQTALGDEGASYVIFGRTAPFTAPIELSSLNGQTGFKIRGIDPVDRSGRHVAGAGDVNGDGFDDLLISGFRGDPGGRNDAGEAYLLFGRGGAYPPSMDLAALDGLTGVTFNGINASDYAGFALDGAGDVNGDGFDDIILGAESADPNGQSLAGQSYVIFGRSFSPLAIESLTVTAANEGSNTSLSLMFTEYNQPHTVTINWGDGHTTSHPLAANVGTLDTVHAYADNGPYTITVTVANDVTPTWQDSATRQVTVGNIAPAMPVIANQTAGEGASFSLSTLTLFSDPGFDNPLNIGGELAESFTFEVSWGDGSAATTGAATIVTPGSPGTATTGRIDAGHVYSDDGSYVVALTVRDDDGGQVIRAFRVNVTNVAPSLTIEAGSLVFEGDSFTLRGTVSDPGYTNPSNMSGDNQEVFIHRIDWGDGSVPSLGLPVIQTPGAAGQPTIARFNATHYFADNGTYTVRITVSDDDLGETVQTFDVTVVNAPPALAVVGNQSVGPGQRLELVNIGTFTDPGFANPSRPGGASFETFIYEIDWGDGTPDSTGAATIDQPGEDGVPTAGSFDGSHIYQQSGQFTVTVTLRDDDGGSGTGTFLVTVSNVPPDLTVVGNQTAVEGSQLSISNIGVFTDFGAGVYTYRIDWGDGTAPDTAVANTVSGGGGNVQGTFNGAHTYADNGPYTVFVTATDPEAASSTRSFQVQVSNVPPTASVAGATSIAEGSPYQLSIGPVNDPGADTVHEWRVDWGDGSPMEFYDTPPGTISHVYPDGPATPTISVTLVDEDGLYSIPGPGIQVFNIIPVVTAGSDVALVVNESMLVTGSFVDPGAEVWTATVDYGDGAGFVPLTLNADKTFSLSLRYATPGTRTVEVRVSDGDGTLGSDTLVVSVSPSFSVSSFTSSATGFTAQFTRAADIGRVNLYDGPDTAVEPSDVTLVGASVGPVDGSLVWDATGSRVTFIKTGAPLLPDNYTVTLASRADGWTDSAGRLLDGNGDGSGGDNYVNTFNIANTAARLVQIPDFARGPSQAASIPNTAAGIPITISDGAGVLSLDVDVVYDPALLSVTGVTRGASAPASWSVTANLTQPGRARITASGVAALPAGLAQALRLTAAVPATAAFGASHIVRLENVRVNGGLITAQGDAALAKVAFMADVDQSLAYTAFDAAFISRVVVGLDTGFDAYAITDPVIIGNSSGTGSLSGLDAAYVAQKAVQLPRPEIPDLPPNLPAPSPGGPDPVIGAPAGIVAQAGQSARVPITIDNLGGLYGATVTVAYSTAILDLDDDQVSLGDELEHSGWNFVQNVEDAAGTARLVVYRAEAGPPGQATLFELNYQVPPTAAGTTPIDLSGPASDGGFSFTYVDGSLSVGLEGDINGDGRVGLRDLHALRQHFGMTAGATRADGDLDGDGDVDHGDLSRLVANYGRTNLAPPQAVIASESQLNRRASDAVLRGRRVSRPTPREAAVDSVLLDDAAFDSLAASIRSSRRAR